MHHDADTWRGQTKTQNWERLRHKNINPPLLLWYKMWQNNDTHLRRNQHYAERREMIWADGRFNWDEERWARDLSSSLLCPANSNVRQVKLWDIACKVSVAGFNLYPHNFLAYSYVTNVYTELLWPNMNNVSKIWILRHVNRFSYVITTLTRKKSIAKSRTNDDTQIAQGITQCYARCMIKCWISNVNMWRYENSLWSGRQHICRPSSAVPPHMTVGGPGNSLTYSSDMLHI